MLPRARNVTGRMPPGRMLLAAGLRCSGFRRALPVAQAVGRHVRDVPTGRAPLMPTETGDRSIRRIELTLHKPWFALYGGIRPTLVIAGLGQPAQWGIGTWQVPADET